jgi:hypothetical protein
MGKGRVGEAKTKISLRETFRSLKSLKTAKSCDFRVQRYQALSKTHDFAGEANSFRFRRFSLRAKPESHFGIGGTARRRGRKNLRFKIRPSGSRNPLITLKTANEMFGKAWRFQAIDLETFGADLEKLEESLEGRAGPAKALEPERPGANPFAAGAKLGKAARRAYFHQSKKPPTRPPVSNAFFCLSSSVS